MSTRVWGKTHLTPREQEVLLLVSSGMTDREIGLQLGIQRQVVKNYNQRIRDKIGADNRVGMTQWAISRGLVKP